MRDDIQRQITKQEKELVEDQHEYFRGTASVNLRKLVFSPEYSREVDKRNVERLKKIFMKQGCLRLSPSNHVPAVIGEQDLDFALQYSARTSEELLNSPQDAPLKLTLHPEYKLKCLHGQHRILAAMEVLRPRDEWWTVDLYLTSMSPESKAALSEEYSNSSNCSDGEIYRKIRKYHGQNKPFAERRWRAYLSMGKQKALGQLLGRESYKMAFDNLLSIRGLWSGPGFSLGNMQEIFAMRLDEEIVHYLEHIWEIWSLILGKDKDLMDKTSQFTVEALQLKAPQASSTDLSHLQLLFISGKLFPEIEETGRRVAIWNNISRIPCIIPSLFTFFEDLKLLSPSVKIIKVLIEPPFKGSLHDMIGQHFSAANQAPGALVIQDTETTFKSVRGSATDQLEFGYRQLHLFALRHFPQMIGNCPKKEKDRPKPVVEESDPVIWHRFALLAYRLGFDSKVISQLRNDDPYRMDARTFLLKHNPPELYTLDQQLLEDCLDQMVMTRGAAVKRETQYIRPLLAVDGPGEPFKRRCGRFFQTAYENERHHLFLDFLYDATDTRGQGITSFFARRSTFFAFFGRRMPSASADVPAGRPPWNPESDMGKEGHRESPGADRDSAPKSSPVADLPPKKRARTQPPAPPPPPNHNQAAVVPTELTPHAIQNVITHSDNGNDNTSKHRIFFQVYQKGGRQDQQQSRSYSDPHEVQRVAAKYIRKGMHLMTVGGRGLTAERCFDVVVRDGTYTVVLVPSEEEEINKLLIASGIGSVAKNEPRRIHPANRMLTRR